MAPFAPIASVKEELTHALHAVMNELHPEITMPVHLSPPKVKEHGDYATNIALQLGKKAGMNPREFADLLAHCVEPVGGR